MQPYQSQSHRMLLSPFGSAKLALSIHPIVDTLRCLHRLHIFSSFPLFSSLSHIRFATTSLQLLSVPTLSKYIHPPISSPHTSPHSHLHTVSHTSTHTTSNSSLFVPTQHQPPTRTPTTTTDTATATAISATAANMTEQNKQGVFVCLAVLYSTLLLGGALAHLALGVPILCVPISYMLTAVTAFATHVIGHHRIFKR